MKKAVYLIFVFTWMLVVHVFGQKPVMELTFTAQYQEQYVMLDSIYIENLTQGGDTILYAPDTALVLDYETGFAMNTALSEGHFRLLQNHPNPFAEQTAIDIFLPQPDRLQLTVSNLLGQKVASYENSMVAGNHSFVFYPGDEKYYFLSASSNGSTIAIKMVNLNNRSSKTCSLSYQVPDNPQSGFKSTMGINDFGFSFGDQLRFTGFVMNTLNIIGSDVIEAIPAGNENFVFDITEGIPCPGTPTVTYEGQTYNTVRIGAQCWMAENLNIGTMIPGTNEMTNDGVIEKYCYEDIATNCATYGGLYQWTEMMQYSTAQGVQGICMVGWHLPTDAEWCTLTQFIDPTVNCNTIYGWTGTDVGIKMKSTTGWIFEGNGTNASGFTGLPGGYRDYYGVFGAIGSYGIFWTSTDVVNTNFSWHWDLNYWQTGLFRGYHGKFDGRSVRCMKD